MNILIAFDKFKHAMTAEEACSYAGEAILKLHPNWKIQKAPLTDGGEGFCELLTMQADGQLFDQEILGPRLEPHNASFGLVKGKNIKPASRQSMNLSEKDTLGIIEMACASGLGMLPPEERNPRQTSTYGTGQLVKAAANAGASTIILGIGGSATNDLGLGALEALGTTFKYKKPHDHFLPEFWNDLISIDTKNLSKLPPLFIACDVGNPLLGPQGASAIYGPQKGLLPEDFNYFENHMLHSARMLCDLFRKDTSLLDSPGSGAAGGIAFALQAAYGATLLPGFDLAAQWLSLEEKIRWADLVLTGEGKFDPSSLQGKGPGSLITLANSYQKPIELFVGCTSGEVEAMIDIPMQSITPLGMSTEAALKSGRNNMQRAMNERFT